MAKVAGLIAFKVDGTQHLAKGAFTYNLGHAKKEAVMGANGVNGYKSTPQVPFIEGEITLNEDISVADIIDIENANVTLELENDSSIVLAEAYYAGEGTGSTEEGSLPVRFEGSSAEII